jgi:hypothetical protein
MHNINSTFILYILWIDNIYKMNVELILCIVIIMAILYFDNMKDYEHLNEGSLHQLYSKNPRYYTNLDYKFTPSCNKHIRSNAVGDRYCNDIPIRQKYIENLYGSTGWIQTKYKSAFFPPYSTRIDPHYMFSPDWWRRWK